MMDEDVFNDAKSEQMRKDFSFLPRAAVESNWRQMKFVPEVAFYGDQYIVGEACDTHEAAMRIADDYAKFMKDGMLALATGMVKTLKRAKA